MAETVGEEAARKAWAAYGRGGCCDEHLEDGDGMTGSG
jgi:RNA 3'-terminal phosphate cyclase